MAHARERVAEHEPLGPLGIGRGEQHRDRATVTVPEDDDALAAHLVDDGRDVVHPPLDRRDGTQRHRVGNAGAPLVEADHPPHRRQALEEARQRRIFPHDLDVIGMIRNEDDLARAPPKDLVAGAPGAIRTTRAPDDARTRAKRAPSFASRSQMHTAGAAFMVAFRACCAHHSSLGATAAWTILRRRRSSKKSTKTSRNRMS
jgi:hypothetical protein